LLVEFSKSARGHRCNGLNYKDQRGRCAWLAEALLATLTGSRAFDLDGRIGIDYGVYGVPEDLRDRQSGGRESATKAHRPGHRRAGGAIKLIFPC